MNAMGDQFKEMSLDRERGERIGRGAKGDVGRFEVHDFVVTRPEQMLTKEGRVGEFVNLRGNYAQMGDFGRDSINQHHVEFQPAVDSKVRRMSMLTLTLIGQGFNKKAIVFDGMILYLPVRLPEPKEDYITYVHDDNGTNVSIKVVWTKELPPGSPMCLTVLNLINRSIMKDLNYRQYGRNFFDATKGQRCNQFGLLIWPGFVSSIRCYDGGMLLNIEQAHKVMRTENVMQVMKKIMNGGQTNLKHRFMEEIQGQVVMSTYNNKTYKVDDICMEMTPMSTFMRGDTQITFKEYFQSQYKRSIIEDKQPLLLSKSNDKLQPDVFLIPELCILTGLTDKQRANRQLMQELSKYTRLQPERRVVIAREHLKQISSNPEVKDRLNTWNLEAPLDLVKIKGRVLPQEKLTFGNGDVDTNGGDWTRSSKRSSCLRGVNLGLEEWVMLIPGLENRDWGLKLFQALQRMGHGQKIVVNMPLVRFTNDTTAQGYVNAIREGFALVRESKTKTPQLLVCLVPNDNKDRYDAIKKQVCIADPVPSQVVQLSSVKKENILDSIATKILVQINCKLGGVPWKVENKFKSLVMHVGYDSYHDSSMRGKSVGAATFTMDHDWTKWFTAAKVHGEGTELMNNLEQFFLDALAAFKTANDGKLPQRIFLWRDGVGEGQIPVVFNMELPQIIRALKKSYQVEQTKGLLEDTVKFTFTIVTKKVNTRVYKEDMAGKFTNPPPGTVVDNTVTRKERYDFYMIPQPVNQGTVTPVMYNVIYDTNMIGPDKMHMLAFKLCHMYYNWQGTIRVPAPCMYAYKAAFLVAQSLHEPIAPQLSDKLSYL